MEGLVLRGLQLGSMIGEHYHPAYHVALPHTHTPKTVLNLQVREKALERGGSKAGSA